MLTKHFRRRHIVDYSKDFTTAKDAEKARDERRRLTANFGSVKKNKMLEANIRRSITTVGFGWAGE